MAPSRESFLYLCTQVKRVGIFLFSLGSELRNCQAQIKIWNGRARLPCLPSLNGAMCPTSANRSIDKKEASCFPSHGRSLRLVSSYLNFHGNVAFVFLWDPELVFSKLESYFRWKQFLRLPSKKLNAYCIMGETLFKSSSLRNMNLAPSKFKSKAFVEEFSSSSFRRKLNLASSKFKSELWKKRYFRLLPFEI